VVINFLSAAIALRRRKFAAVELAGKSMKLPENEKNALKAFDPEHPEDEKSSEQLDPPPQTEAIDPDRGRIHEDFNDKEGQTEIWQSFESP
jgi:hypothetical protein